MDAEKLLKTGMLMFLVIHVASGRKAPEDSLTSAVSAPNSSTASVNELEVTLKAAAAGSQTSEFYKDGIKAPSPTTFIIAGFQNGETSGIQMLLKKWITWIVLVVLSFIGISITVHCRCHNCYSTCTTSLVAPTLLNDTAAINVSSAVSSAEDS